MWSGDPSEQRTKHKICLDLVEEGEDAYDDTTWYIEELAERDLTNISGYKCDEGAHLEFC